LSTSATYNCGYTSETLEDLLRRKGPGKAPGRARQAADPPQAPDSFAQAIPPLIDGTHPRIDKGQGCALLRAGLKAKGPHPFLAVRTVSAASGEERRWRVNKYHLETVMTDANMSILVVDDYNTMVRIIKKLLKTIGYENVDEASNGEEALGKIKQKQYGLIISDWNMEPMTGFELLKAVRADETTAKTPFILVTAESKPENVLAAQQAGVSSYLVKPFSAPALKEKIDAVLAA
jgi:two-component system chemotaxis response regulator CheY